MAVLGANIDLPEFEWNKSLGESAHEQAFVALMRASDEAGKRGEVKGRLIRFQVADGYAWYRVEKLRPLTLGHIDYLDGYAISAVYIRGLRLADVKDQLDHADRIAAFFAKQA
jgi:hypothetical protein